MTDGVVIAAIVAASNAITNGFGFRSVGMKLKAVADDLGEKLKNKIDVGPYSAKMNELHNIINEQAKKIVALEIEIAHLKGRP